MFAWFDYFLEGLEKWFTDFSTRLGDVKSSVWDLLRSVSADFDLFFGRIGGFLSDRFTELNTWLTGIKDSFIEWLSQAVDNLVEFKDNSLAWFSNFFSSLGTFFHDLVIPSDGYFRDNFNTLKTALLDKLQYNQLIDGISQFKDLESSAPENITCELYGQTFTIVDWSSIISVQPIIYFLVRGFFYPFIFIYHYNQIYKLIRGQSYTSSGKPGSEVQGQQYWDWGSK